jgi:hypothetical protein
VRVRLIRPAYWTDADLQTRLTAEVREFYIGLWMEADDEGYIDWDLTRIGAELYPYRGPAWRRRLERWTVLLGSHLVVLPCGRHAVIPSLPKHQNPPRPTAQYRRQHDRCLVPHMAPDGTTAHQVLEGNLREGNLRGVGGADGKSTASDDLASAPWNKRAVAARGES